MDFSASNTGIRATDIIPNRKQVAQSVAELSKDLKIKLIDNINGQIPSKSLSFAADMWSCSSTKEKYMDVSVQYIDSNWNVVSTQLAMIHFPEKHDHLNIRKKIDSVLADLDNIEKSDCIFVTDSGPNILKACQDYYIHYRCLAHRYSTTTNEGFRNACNKSEFLLDFDRDVTNLIGYCNKSEINNNLPCRLKSGCKTRPWRHLYEKFYSVYQSFDALKDILSKVIKYNFFNI